MSARWTALQLAYWRHLETVDDYLRLGLKEFRYYDGRLPPFEADEKTRGLPLVRAEHLPCHAVSIDRAGVASADAPAQLRQAPGVIVGRVVDFVALRGMLAYSAAAPNAASALLEDAMGVIEDALTARAQVRALRAALPPNGGQVAFAWRAAPVAFREPGAGAPRQWSAFYEITLVGTGRQEN